MKRLFIIAGISLLAGCANYATQAVKPPNMVKVLDNNRATTYFSFEGISAYNNNPHLRQFYTINNYKEPGVISKEKNLSIYSSRTINVVNCDRMETAAFELTFFSEPFAKGLVIARRDEVGQWRTFSEKSIIEMIRGLVCRIDPSRLKPALPKDTQTPLLG
ncbi:hypothetical protein Ppb6_01331 [Photorhabdus australis subsp. thailandensis]|uniref:Surface-adhesin protein E-like domain-containing protein n=1 Tax=Photorhabdus australis subsp. thailandensis TaxID=2805096 RepID=A0A1C0U695_9GAMM|nr:surface-adhesin E family protein [Photorhabdus australis]OCQ53444.1 hypothetical protein Ppb6_01331 [Photorhabdus australis subsp. thailandensis]